MHSIVERTSVSINIKLQSNAHREAQVQQYQYDIEEQKALMNDSLEDVLKNSLMVSDLISADAIIVDLLSGRPDIIHLSL